MTAPQDAPAGPVLTKDERWALVEAFMPHTDDPAAWAIRIAPTVAALLFSAREEGAAAERERIIASLRRFKHEPFAQTYATAMEESAALRALDGPS